MSKGDGLFNVELGPASIKKTKTGAGDKEEAYVVNKAASNLLFGVCMLVTAAVVLALFLTQWEVTIARKKTADQKTLVDHLQKDARVKLIRVGAVLENFLINQVREEREAEKVGAEMYDTLASFKENHLKGKDELAKKFDEFSHVLMDDISDFLKGIEDDADDAKKTLKAISSLMGNVNFYPQAQRDKMVERAEKNAKTARQGNTKELEKAMTAWSVEAMIGRFFNRLDYIDSIEVPDEVMTEVGALVDRYEVESKAIRASGDSGPQKRVQHRELSADCLQKLRTLMAAPGVKGVAADKFEHPQLVDIYLREVRSFMLVSKLSKPLKAIQAQWKTKEIEPFHAFEQLQKMATDSGIPFEWIFADDKKMNRRKRRKQEREAKRQANGRPQTGKHLAKAHMLTDMATSYGWWASYQEFKEKAKAQQIEDHEADRAEAETKKQRKAKLGK